MSRKVNSYSKHKKAEVALSAIKEEKSYVEIAVEHNIPATNVRDWLKKLREEAHTVFELPHEKQKKVEKYKKEILLLQQVLGKITVENDYLKKKLGQ
jgi:transposase-like protein|tara:strand:+ start:89 stop:379 length:291 start_codon:yes stop_codon:yes gene_type:complete